MKHKTSNPVEKTTDIAIVGGGAVGLAAALALAKQGWSLTVIGDNATPADGRTVALLGESWQLLAEIGIKTGQLDAAPLSIMRIIDDTGSLFRPPPVDFRASEIGLDAFGWNVGNSRLVAMLAAQAKTVSSIRLVNATATGIEPDADGVSITGDGFAPLRASLVIGADGKNSLSRSAAGITTTRWSYDQVALTGIFSHGRDHNDASTEFHTRQGPCTVVPLPGRRSSLVWMMSPREAERIGALDDSTFARAVEDRIHSLLGKMVLDGPRGCVPMGGLSVDRFAADRIMLVGEAAHAFPPIGAQGLNLGLRDVIALRAVLEDAGQEPGHQDCLSAYDRSRRSDVRMRTTAVDALNRSLLADFLPADALRGAGLLALGEIGPLRRFVMRNGLGGGTAPSRQETAR